MNLSVSTYPNMNWLVSDAVDTVRGKHCQVTHLGD